MKSISSAIVVACGLFGMINAHRLVTGPDPLGGIAYVICGTVLVFGIGGWLYCLKNDD